MSKSDGASVWGSRAIGFLVGGVLVLAIMGFGWVSPLKGEIATLTTRLDELENGAARLLGEAKVLVGNGSYESAQRALATLFEKQPGSNEAAEGRKLYAEIETAMQQKNQKWEAASVAVRTAWEKKAAAELRAKSEMDRQLMETNMVETLKSEWEKSKDKIRQEWEKGES